MLYVSNLPKSSQVVNVKDELVKVSDWFEAKKLSVNIGKTEYSFSHKSRRSDDLQLRLLNETLVLKITYFKTK